MGGCPDSCCVGRRVCFGWCAATNFVKLGGGKGQ